MPVGANTSCFFLWLSSDSSFWHKQKPLLSLITHFPVLQWREPSAPSWPVTPGSQSYLSNAHYMLDPPCVQLVFVYLVSLTIYSGKWSFLLGACHLAPISVLSEWQWLCSFFLVMWSSPTNWNLAPSWLQWLVKDRHVTWWAPTRAEDDHE